MTPFLFVLCTTFLVGALARNDSPRTLGETLNKHVVIVRSTADDGSSTLRLQMVRSSDSKLFLKYRYSDGDGEDESQSRVQYSLRLDHLIEYEESGDADSGYQPNEDHLVQTVTFKGTDFTDWVGSTDADGARAFYTTNGVFGLTARVSARRFEAGDDAHTEVMPDEIKFDVAITSFPWLSQRASYVAVVAAVQSSMNIERSDDGRRIEMDDSDAYITWNDRCVFDHDNTNCTIVLSAITDADSREDDEGHNDDQVKELIFAFVTDNGRHPASLVWDPIMGSDPSAASSGAVGSFGLVLAGCAAAALALLM